MKQDTTLWKPWCRSREGAWIEIAEQSRKQSPIPVAPVRERGLKCTQLLTSAIYGKVAPVRERGLKYAGAWAGKRSGKVAPVRERGLKYRWRRRRRWADLVAPVRERGLKFMYASANTGFAVSLPWGSVDWNRHWLAFCWFWNCRSREGAWIEIQSIKYLIWA